MELGTEKLKEIYKRYRGLFFASFAAGLAAYGMMLTNVLNNHDSVYNLPSGFGAGVTSGRWFLELLGRLIDEYKVDGVLEMTLQACHTYNVESLAIRRFVNDEKGLPYINVETDYSQNDVGQLNTRIAAFLEML